MEQLEPEQLELLKRYEEELEELELLPPATIELPAPVALALITHIQIAFHSPDRAVALNPLLPRAIEGAKQIQSSFNPESAIYEVLELGWHKPKVSDKDVPHRITSMQWQKQLLPPLYFPDDYHHF